MWCRSRAVQLYTSPIRVHVRAVHILFALSPWAATVPPPSDLASAIHHPPVLGSPLTQSCVPRDVQAHTQLCTLHATGVSTAGAAGPPLRANTCSQEGATSHLLGRSSHWLWCRVPGRLSWLQRNREWLERSPPRGTASYCSVAGGCRTRGAAPRPGGPPPPSLPLATGALGHSPPRPPWLARSGTAVCESLHAVPR